MGFGGYIDLNGQRHWLKDCPAVRGVEFSEHPRDAKEFPDQASITTYLSGRPGTLVALVQGGTGTPAGSLSHAGKRYADRTP